MSFCGEVAGLVDEERTVNSFCLDIHWGFWYSLSWDPYRKAVDGWMSRVGGWIRESLTVWIQKVVVSGAKSCWRRVTCGVLQGSVWIWSHLTTSFMIWCTQCKFADDTKLWGMTGRPGNGAAIQGDLVRLEKWMDRNLPKFSEGKCWVAQLCRIGAGDPGGHQVECESSVFCCRSGD